MFLLAGGAGFLRIDLHQMLTEPGDTLPNGSCQPSAFSS